jgi:UDP-N-acetylglucosamine--N-acetylmuramyl-(pentapeptide) pyrophosphoryl-undecaprenol N-acetylglucosamine transferase
MMNIAFTGGGTGGHIYPGLAVAAELKKQLESNPQVGNNYRIFWIGSSSGMDRSIVEEAGIEFFGVPSGKLRRYFSLRTAVDLFKVIISFIVSRKILKKQKPCFLFSKGGFVSVPPCAAAASLGIPVFTHESDFSPGLATKLNTRFVSRTGGKVFTAYDDTVRFFSQAIQPHVIVSGNPVRNVFYDADPAKGRAFLNLDNETRFLLVLGGSQGAKEINELIRATLPELTEQYTVVHQTGPGHQWDLSETERYKPFPYIKDELPFIMTAAEIIIGRSGAGIFEWAVCGKPMILIPLTGSGTRGDQIENARYFEKAGAAFVLTGENANTNELIKAVKSLSHDTEKREAMAVASFRIGERNGAKIITNTLIKKINIIGETK